MIAKQYKATPPYWAVFVLLCAIGHCSHALKFKVEPHDIIVPESSSVLLPCEGTLTDSKSNDGQSNKFRTAPNIRWRGPDGQDIGIVGDTFRVQLPNGSLFISSIEDNRGLTGSYQCLLSSDGIGTIVSRSAIISLAKLPETNNMFNELYLYPGQTAYIQCLSVPMPKYKKYRIQWLKDDIPLTIDETRMVILSSGAIEIDELVASDKGTYQCNITLGSVHRLSSKTSLNIKSDGEPQAFQAPTFLTESLVQTIVAAAPVTLDCVANGNPKPQIKWLKDGEDIDISNLDSRFRIAGTGSLHIAIPEDADSGNYQCRAINSIDSSDIQVSLQVQVPPSFVQRPADKVAHEKDELEMLCSVSGKPTPVVQWLKNGDVITPNEYMQIVGGHNLRIFGLISSDAGMFQCTGVNQAGSIQAAARLQIVEQEIESKKLKKNPKKMPKHPKKDKKEDASVTKSMPINSKIEKHSIMNDFDDINYDDEDEQTDDERIVGEANFLDFNHFNITGSKEQTSLTRNNMNNNMDTDEITDPRALMPGAPRDLVAQIINPRLVALSWLEPLKNPDEVTSYSVYYKINTSERERKIQTKDRDEQMANIGSLLPGKTYSFRVVGNSTNGPGESSNIYEIHTQPEENIAGPVRNVVAEPLSHQEIHVSWERPSITNGNVTKYRIYYSEMDSGDVYMDSVAQEALLTELRPYTEYTISIVAFNENGMGDTSNEYVVKTFSAAPSEAPMNVTLETTSSTSITVRWEPPPIDGQNGQITGYKIKYKKLKKHIQVATTPANVRHFELRELEKMSSYQMKMAALTINGTGPFSEWYHIDTYENDLIETRVPGQPAWLKTRATANSIMITWGAPNEQDIRVRNYVLGYGLGIPDVDTQILDENIRFYEIVGLQPNGEYVISLRARNNVGDGEPRYGYIQPRDEFIDTGSTVLAVPVGLRAITMSAASIVVYWTDTTASRNVLANPNRQYVVRYNIVDSTRYKYHNTSDLSCSIEELKPNTQYEFAVKVTKGRRESAWSMSVLNATFAASSTSPPRELSVYPDPKNPQVIVVKWTPPRNTNGLINGYVVFYTTDMTKRDRDWLVEAVVNYTNNKAYIKNLKPHTTYHFKVQTRNVNRSNGVFSTVISYTTGHILNTQNSHGDHLLGSILSNEVLIYVIGGIMVVTLLISARVVYILCRRKPETTPDHKQGYNKNNPSIKPPDLWIHHDQMELKNVDKNSHSSHHDGASSSMTMTLPRVTHSDLEHHDSHMTNSLDKRSYVPGYLNTTLERSKHLRAQYGVGSRTQLDTPMSHNMNAVQTPGAQTPENPYGYDSMPSNYSNPSITYAPGLSIDVPKAANRGQGHPLKSFSVPGPPPTANVTMTPTMISNLNKHNVPAVTIRPQNSSPYKKVPGGTPSILSNTLTNRIQQGGPHIAHSTDEIQRLAPSLSAEELNQEMANLEGLMKDLSAITANEFEC